ncbi:MAG: flavodoxin family protein [Deferribacterota bacterium]|nr:flavodoxin family protein [Deferribacterota bacterium]
MDTYIINSSPREKGSCAFIANKIEEDILKDKSVKTLNLNKMNYRGCQACYSCKLNNSFCVVDDGLSPYLADFSKADLFIILTPNYYGFCSGQLKLFLDRWFCLIDKHRRSKLKEGGKLFFIVTQGAPDRSNSGVLLKWIERFAKHYFLKFYGIVVPNCSKDNLDSPRLKFDEIKMALNMFI